jgi:amino acid adenylation domain-containing protein
MKTKDNNSYNHISKTDIQKIKKWNETDCVYENGICIHEKFEQQVELYPDSPALFWGDTVITYDELNRHSNRLAHYLIDKGTKPDMLVALCLERSPEMMIGIYAILKAGAAYMPVDPNSPRERMEKILEDGKPLFILTSKKSDSNLSSVSGEKIYLDNIISKPYADTDTNPSSGVNSGNLAYIIYTSGSTGVPKGVMIEHHSVLNRLGWMQKAYPLTSKDVLVQKTPVTFDVSVWELFWWAFNGASLALLQPGEEKEPERIVNAIYDYNVSVIHFVPSMFGAFISYLDSLTVQAKIVSLKKVFLSGEALPPAMVNEFNSLIGEASETAVINLYGPTEATVDVSHYLCPKTNSDTMYIGKPIDNTKLLVINEKNQILPIGDEGELVIGGVNLARGYLNRDELNSEKFIEIEYFDGRKLRVYKTGDIVKYVESGDIFYIGRVDNQVKIRGFRIELGEVEAKIMEYKGIKSCAVIVDRSNLNNPLLIAYIKSTGTGSIDTAGIKLFLGERIPSYMIPTSFIALKEMPLTSSGKIDRKALPKPQSVQPVHNDIPEDKIEGIILSIWQDVLQNENIDISTNFFDIGGNSIMIPLIASRLQKDYSLKVNTMDIFQYPTVESLASFLNSKTKKGPQGRSAGSESLKGKRDQRIAIIGIAGKFPEADDKESFWKLLCEGKECIRFFSDEELEKDDTTFEKNRNNPNYIKSRGILNNIEQWDAKFFGYSPHDARYTDPQQRLWFETVWNALEDAGCDPYTYKGEIGVFAGVNLNAYLYDNILRNRQIYEDYMHFGDSETFQTYVNNDAAFIATRTAYIFDLRGPAINVQSACSTSLMAVCQACNSLILGDTDMVVAGASSVQTPQKIGYLYQPDGMRSSDGHCRPFDSKASGTVFSNAIGAVVLKRLEDAERDNDDIYGVIRGWALNNDGYDKIGFAAVSVNGQVELYRKSLAKANVNPEDICYIEAHGTATILGDPIEATALSQAFREKTAKKQFCAIGSIKGNIGHTDEAAGIMGFIKVALAAKYRKIPLTINYSTPNPNIDFNDSPFYVATSNIDWVSDKPLIMCVNAFGVGGTNAQVIIEDYKKQPKPVSISEDGKSGILTASAKSALSLENNINNLVEFYNTREKGITSSDICYTAQLRRAHWQNKAFAVVSKDKKLEASDFIQASHNNKTKKIVFLYPGQGAQFVNMGLALYNEEPLFRKQLDKGFEIFKRETGKDLKEIIFSDNESNALMLNQTQYTQPALFIISYAVVKLYEHYGILPDESIGHSIGEYVSACVSEVFDFETALKIVIKRGQLMQTVAPGSMMAVRAESEKLFKICGDAFEVAAINAPQSCTITFRTEMFETVEQILKDNSIEHVFLKTSHAFHSSQFDVILKEFENYVNKFTLKAPKHLFISCLTGEYINSINVISGKYWANQLRNTVQFNKGIETILGNSDCVFIEAGPNNHLSGLTRQNKTALKKTRIIPSIGRPDNGNTYEAFLESIGNIWTAGLSPDFKKFYEGKNPSLVKIPTYAFDKKRYWIDIDREKLKEAYESGNFIDQNFEVKAISSDATVVADAISNLNLSETEKSILEIWIQSLGSADIEITDNFFDLGGHSLLAVQILNNIKEKFNTTVSLQKFLSDPTIESLSRMIGSSESKNVTVSKEPYIHLTDHSHLPLSDAQKRLWTISNLNKTSPAYNISSPFRIVGDINFPAFQETLETLFSRHHVIHSVFRMFDNQPYCQISDNREVKIENIDISGLPDELKEKKVNEIIGKDVHTPFDLEKGPLYRLTLIKTGPKEYYFHFNVHHLVFDGLSWTIFVNDFNHIYKSISDGSDIKLNPIRYQQYDYAFWQQNNPSVFDTPELIDFWANTLNGVPQRTNFPYDKNRDEIPKGIGAKEKIEVSSEIVEKLIRIYKKENSTAFLTVLSAFSILIKNYSDEEDLCLGTVVSNRPDKSLENIFGMFVNTLPLRFNFNDIKDFKGLLKYTKDTVLGAIAHQDLPFEKIVDIVKPERSLFYNPIFQIAIAWQDNLGLPLKTGTFTGERIFIKDGVNPFDITVYMWENGDVIEGEIVYDLDILKRETIIRFRDNFIKILETIGNQPNESIARLSVISDMDKTLYSKFNSTDSPIPGDMLHGLFEKQAKGLPEKTALVSGDISLTYSELDNKANRLAAYLGLMGVKEGDIVGICLERSADMIVSVLAVLKAGCCYLPLDPSFPLERLNYMVRDSGTRIIISQSALKSKAEDFLVPSLIFIDKNNSEISACSAAKPDVKTNTDSLAYIIYTSGSTGRPKGVPVRHQSVVNMVTSMTKTPGFSSSDNLLAVVTLSFDMSVYEIFLSLSNGATLVMANSPDITDGQVLEELINKHNITVLQATPSLWNILLKSGWRGKKDLKALCGGEALNTALIRQVLPLVGEFWNCYGPTETTVYSTCTMIKDPEGVINIGRPLNNTKIYILDKNNFILPVGSTGEVAIGGKGVSTGYLNLPAMTAEKFVILENGEFVYKTGDIGCYRDDGNVELFGRADNQIKLRGFRIEPGEIENLITRLPGVKEAVIKLHMFDDNDDRLVAFMVTYSSFKMTKEEIIESLSNQLPQYMIPSFFKFYDDFPRLPNGKVNKKELIFDEKKHFEEEVTEISLSDETLTSTEKTVLDIWRSNLKTKNIAMSDHFFNIGGNSLMAISIVTQINETFKIELGLRIFFDRPRIKDIAEAIDFILRKSNNNSSEQKVIDTNKKIIKGEL